MYWSVVFYCLNLLLILSLIHTPTNSERFYSWRSNGKKKRTNLRLQDLTARKFEATRHKTHPKTRIQDQSKTLLRLQDQVKIFFHPHFSSYHSIPLTVHSFYPPPQPLQQWTLYSRIKNSAPKPPQYFNQRCSTPGGRGKLNKVLYGWSNPLTFYIPFLTEKEPLLYTFHCQV